MINYAILAHPGQNRVYFDSTQDLFLRELHAAAGSLVAAIEDIGVTAIGGVPYIAFRSGGPTAEALAGLQRLSFFYALFERAELAGRPALLPVDLPPVRYFPESLSSLLKYAGKTNERFTRMMVNLARACCETGNGGALHLFDPLCGKGTTLYEGLIDGMDVSGVEISPAFWQETKTYIVKFLEHGHHKHKASGETVPGAKGKKLADVFKLAMANDKAAYDAGQVRNMRLVNGDTRLAARFFKKSSFDILVADLPYGVQHAGKRAQPGRANATEGDLAALLDESLPGWVALMKPGGAAALSFNEFTLKKADVEALMEKHGLAVKREYPYDDFQHRVDQGIKRDLVVAVKK